MLPFALVVVTSMDAQTLEPLGTRRMTRDEAEQVLCGEEILCCAVCGLPLGSHNIAVNIDRRQPALDGAIPFIGMNCCADSFRKRHIRLFMAAETIERCLSAYDRKLEEANEALRRAAAAERERQKRVLRAIRATGVSLKQRRLAELDHHARKAAANRRSAWNATAA